MSEYGHVQLQALTPAVSHAGAERCRENTCRCCVCKQAGWGMAQAARRAAEIGHGAVPSGTRAAGQDDSRGACQISIRLQIANEQPEIIRSAT